METVKLAEQPSPGTFDLAIAYRVYPGISGTPALCPHDKFKLVAVCLGSFKRALGSLRVKMWILLDGCPPIYEDLFRTYFSDVELEVINLDGVGNEATFAMQVDILSNQTAADLVYFAEDDYFYLPGGIAELADFARNSNVDFVTPYDHPDRYQDSTQMQTALVRSFGDRHWRTTSSTCLTFMASRAALIANRSLFKSFSRGADDCAIWQAITQKLGLLNLSVHAATAVRFKIWINTWLRGFSRILFARSYQLWSPLPSVATHLALPFLAPGVDWHSNFDRWTAPKILVSSSEAAMPRSNAECDGT